MLVEFDTIAAESNIWIYPSSRVFSDEEIAEIKQLTEEFLSGWLAHGAALKAAYTIRHNRFIILAVDTSFHTISGCAIDTSVNFIKQLEQKFQVDLMDRMNVSYIESGKIHYKPLKDFRKMVKNKSVSKNTIVFNNLVSNKQEFTEHWEVPAKDSWHGNFF